MEKINKKQNISFHWMLNRTPESASDSKSQVKFLFDYTIFFGKIRSKEITEFMIHISINIKKRRRQQKLKNEECILLFEGSFLCLDGNYILDLPVVKGTVKKE